MIGFLRWLRGEPPAVIPHDPTQLEEERDFAESDLQVSRAARAWATRVGTEQREILKENHFSEKIAAALEGRTL